MSLLLMTKFQKCPSFKKSSNFVIVLVGDHGMSDSGSHGGSSESETEVPLIFLSPFFKLSKKSKIKYTVCPLTGTLYLLCFLCADDFRDVQQVDLVPTLAAILGVNVPKRNLGVLLDPFELLTDDTFAVLSVWRKNAFQLLNLLPEHDCSRNVETGWYTVENFLLQTSSFVYSCFD